MVDSVRYINSSASEYDECVMLANYLDLLQRQGKILRYTHVPLETYTKSWFAKMKNKQMGVHAGFPDYIILTNKRMLCIEMKRVKGGQLSMGQTEWLEDLNRVNIDAFRCNGFDDAKKVIDKFIK